MMVAWTSAEDEALCRAYVQVVEGGKASTDNAKDIFWIRVLAKYQDLIGKHQFEQRAWTALQSRWAQVISPDVRLYAAIRVKVVEEHPTGWTDDDYNNEVFARFASQRKEINSRARKSFERTSSQASEIVTSHTPKRPPKARAEEFKFMNIFEILKSSTVFSRIVFESRKRRRMSQSLDVVDPVEPGEEAMAPDSVSAGHETVHAVDHFSLLRQPDGREGDEEHSVRTPASSTASRHVSPPAESQRMLTKIAIDRVHLMKQKIDIAKMHANASHIQAQAAQAQIDIDIMRVDFNSLSDIAKEYFKLRQQEVMTRMQRQFSGDS